MNPARAGEESGAAEPLPSLSVAFLPFEYEEQVDSRIGQRLAELLTEALKLDPSLKVQGPDEARHAAGGELPRMADLLRPETAARLGGQLGVEAAVTGQVYALEGRFYVVAKVVGCSSSSVFGIGAHAPLSVPLTEVVEALAPGVDDLLSERRPELTRPAREVRRAEEALEARVRALARQIEPPPVIAIAAEPEEAAGKLAEIAQERVAQRVRRVGMTTRVPRAADLVQWARSLHDGSAHEIPGPLRGQGIVVAMWIETQPGQESGALSVVGVTADSVWLDARDGTRLGSARVTRCALGRGKDSAAAAAARRAAQAVFEEAFSEALGRWEARHRAEQATVAGAANP